MLWNHCLVQVSGSVTILTFPYCHFISFSDRREGKFVVFLCFVELSSPLLSVPISSRQGANSIFSATPKKHAKPGSNACPQMISVVAQTKLDIPKPSMYRVTIQVDSNLQLTSKHKFRFSMRPMY